MRLLTVNNNKVMGTPLDMGPEMQKGHTRENDTQRRNTGDRDENQTKRGLHQNSNGNMGNSTEKDGEIPANWMQVSEVLVGRTAR